MDRIDILEWSAFWQAGLMDPDHLRDVAYAALESGLDSQEIRLIAGDSRLHTGVARDLLALVLPTLGVDPPSGDAAWRIIAVSVGRSVVAGAVEPLWGADLVGGNYPREDDWTETISPLVGYSCPCCNGLDEMSGAASRKARISECRVHIREYFREILPLLAERAGIPADRLEGPGFLGWNYRPAGVRWPFPDLERNIRYILSLVWDPIGVGHELPPDEYGSFVPVVLRLVKEGASAEALEEHLRRIEAERFSMLPDENGRKRGIAVQELLALGAGGTP